MGTGLLLQYLVVAIAVVLSMAFVANKQFPDGVRRLRIACALPLMREQRAPWLQRVGRWLAPAPVGDAGSCGGCNSCGPAK